MGSVGRHDYDSPVVLSEIVRRKMKAWRIINGYSAEEAANALDVSKTWYSRFECGLSAPSIDVLFKVGKLFELEEVTSIFLKKER